MKKIVRIFLWILCVAISLPAIAANTEKTLTPTDDVYIYKGTAGTGNEITGMEGTIKTYFSDAADNNIYNRVSFLKFDLVELSTNVLSAKFRLYADIRYQRTIEVYQVSGTTWAEDALTFKNFVSEVGTRTLIDTLQISATGAKYYEWDLTSAVKSTKQAGQRYFAIMLKDRYSVKSGTSGITQDWHSKENASGNKPQLVVTEKDNSALELSALTVGGNAIPDFNSKVYSYVVDIPLGTTIPPLVEGTPNTAGAQVNVVPASNLNGSESQRTTKVTITYSGDLLTYSVLFRFLPSENEALLRSLTVAGKTLVDFASQTKKYTYYLPYTTTATPVVAAEATHPQTQVQVVPASNVNGSVAEHTTSIVVTSPNQSASVTYEVEFVVLPKLDLYLFIGQSNMAGRGTMSVAEKTEVIENTLIFNDKDTWEDAINPLNKYSNIRKDISQQQICPAYGFSKKIPAEIKQQIGIVVNAQGGSNITSWGKGAELYEKTMLRAKEAQKWGEYKAILWHQGESNSNANAVNAYPTQLLNMVNSLRADLGNDSLYFVAGELAYWRGDGTGSTAFNNMIRTISTFIPNSDWISAEGLTPLIDFSDPHFDAASQKTLGVRYADKVLDKIYPDRNIEKPYFKSFSVLYPGNFQQYVGTFNENDISIMLPPHSNITALVPFFDLSENAKAYIGTEEQTSGDQVVDFSNPVVYRLSLNGKSESSYTVTVSVEETPTAAIALRFTPKLYVRGNSLYVEDIQGKAMLTLYNMTGSVVMQTTIYEATAIPLSTAGVYVAVLRQGKSFFVEKILVQSN